MTKKIGDKDTQVSKFPQQQVRKPYAKPQLINYGDMEKLTQTGGSVSTDGVGRLRK